MSTFTKETRLFPRIKNKVLLVHLFLYSIFVVGSCRIVVGPFGIQEVPDASRPSTIVFTAPATTTRGYENVKSSWTVFKEDWVPIFTFVGSCLSSIFFIFRMYRCLHLHWKYRRFTFTRRSRAETAAIRYSNAIIDMDPLRYTANNNREESGRNTVNSTTNTSQSLV